MPTDSDSDRERRVTTDRETIRTWAEDREGVPAYHADEDRYEFRRREELGESHEEHTWDEFFTAFDERDLAFVYGSRDEPPEDAFEDYELADRNRIVGGTAVDEGGATEGTAGTAETTGAGGEAEPGTEPTTGSDTGGTTDAERPDDSPDLDTQVSETEHVDETDEIDGADADVGGTERTTDDRRESTADAGTERRSESAGTDASTGESERTTGTADGPTEIRDEDADVREGEPERAAEGVRTSADTEDADTGRTADSPPGARGDPTDADAGTGPTTFSTSEEGKTVVDDRGETVGMVVEVAENRLYVDPDPGIGDRIKAHLGWGGRDEDTYPLDPGRIESIEEDRIRLRHVDEQPGTQ